MTGVWDARAIRSIIRAQGRRVAAGTEVDLTELAELRGDLEAAIRVGVHGLRGQGCSWQNIGDALGVTKASAYERYK